MYFGEVGRKTFKGILYWVLERKMVTKHYYLTNLIGISPSVQLDDTIYCTTVYIRYSLRHGAFLKESLGNYRTDIYVCIHSHCDTQAGVMDIRLKSEQNTEYATYF